MKTNSLPLRFSSLNRAPLNLSIQRWTDHGTTRKICRPFVQLFLWNISFQGTHTQIDKPGWKEYWKLKDERNQFIVNCSKHCWGKSAIIDTLVSASESISNRVCIYVFYDSRGIACIGKEDDVDKICVLLDFPAR